MGRDEELFFHFLRLGLWGEEPDEPGYDMTGLTRDDWCRIYDMGHRQAVSGIVTDGIAALWHASGRRVVGAVDCTVDIYGTDEQPHSQ